ncbi:MAG: Hpt domain-containing protein [Cypionkella sp.]
MTVQRMDQSGESLQGLDDDTLSRLLALAGPADGPELMRLLIGDVSQVYAEMREGLAAQDREVMRKNSHILLAIAGTIGAPRVYELAKRLNQCAKVDDFASAQPDAVELLTRLEYLIVQLRQTADDLGMSL